MAFSGTYWKATKQVASTGNLTDFSFIVADLPTAFFTACTSNDGTKLRCAKDDGVTELAFDPIEFDTTTETIVLRVKWSGSITPTGTYTLRIYPALTENVSYARTDTYGQDNAYLSSRTLYLPMQGGTYEDRTSNDWTFTGTGTLTEDSNGLIGSALNFDSALLSLPTNTSIYNGDTFSVSLSFKYDEIYTSTNDLFNKFSYNDGPLIRCFTGFSGLVAYLFTADGNYDIQYPSLDSESTVWHQLCYTYDGSIYSLYMDGTLVDSISATGVADTNTQDFKIGSTAFNGSMSDFHIDNGVALSSAEVAEDYNQKIDNATFWGTWTEVSAGQDYELSLDTGIYNFLGNDISLLMSRLLNIDSGSYSYAGNDISLLADRLLNIEAGDYIYTGYDLQLSYGKDYILDLDTGSFVLTGNGINFLADRGITLEEGNYTLTGETLALLSDRSITLSIGEYKLTGNDVEFVYGLGYVLKLEAGDFALSGIDIDFFKNSSIDLEVGSFNFIGNNVELKYSGETSNNIIILSDSVTFDISVDDDGNIIMLDSSLDIDVDEDLTILSGTFVFDVEEVI